mgnify:CR=1 FL=1
MDRLIERDRNLELSLFLIRITVTIFMMVWAVDKIVNVRHAQGVLSTFYGWKDVSAQFLAGVGVVQVLILLAFAAGAFKPWSYGAVFLMHAASTIVGWSRMIPPYGPQASITFWAAVPVLAAILALVLLRDRDRLLTVGR